MHGSIYQNLISWNWCLLFLPDIRCSIGYQFFCLPTFLLLFQYLIVYFFFWKFNVRADIFLYINEFQACLYIFGNWFVCLDSFYLSKWIFFIHTKSRVMHVDVWGRFLSNISFDPWLCFHFPKYMSTILSV